MIHRQAKFLLYFAFASGLACGDSADEDTDTEALAPAPAPGAAPNATPAPGAAGPNAAPAEQPPAVDTVAPEIPGVVAAGVWAGRTEAASRLRLTRARRRSGWLIFSCAGTRTPENGEKFKLFVTGGLRKGYGPKKATAKAVAVEG